MTAQTPEDILGNALENSLERIPDSRFNMWRAIFALAHADNVITDHEEKFMRDAINQYPFSPEQKQILEMDIEKGAHVGECFQKIADRQDRSDFFIFARLLVWCDGDFDDQERHIMTELKRVHISGLDFQTMLKDVQVSFEDNEKDQMKERMRTMYNSLQDTKESEGGFLGGVVRQMWTSEEARSEYEENQEQERLAKAKAEKEAREGTEGEGSEDGSPPDTQSE